MSFKRKEILVFVFIVGVFVSLGTFFWLLGGVSPFRAEIPFELRYAFAGGIELGSPVRVAGIKAGKVTEIDFLKPEERKNDGAEVKVKIKVDRRAVHAIKQDSKFYVNMAGIIGERYIEISPGSDQSAVLAENSVARGIDPPRVDQLLSQGYGVFGRVQEFLEANQQNVTDMITSLSTLLHDANKLLKGDDKKKVFALIDRLSSLTSDLKDITTEVKGPRAQKIYERLEDIIRRAHEIDYPALKKFLQEEGVRARLF